MNKDILKIVLRIFLVALFTILSLWFLFYYFFSIAGGIEQNKTEFVTGILVLFANFIIGFVYKLITKSGLLFKIAVGLFIIFIFYLVVSGILFLIRFCPSAFNFMPNPRSWGHPDEQSYLQIFFCPFSARVH